MHIFATRLEPPATADRLPVDQAIDRFYTTDVFMHTWDLARATGQDDRLIGFIGRDPSWTAALSSVIQRGFLA